MRRLLALVLVFTVGCADIAPAEQTPFARTVRDELAREAPLETKSGSPLQPLAGHRFIFVGGFLNEGIPGYFADAVEVVREEIGADALTLYPSSSSNVLEDAALIRRTVLERFAEDGRPIVLVGHSKGGAGVLLAVMTWPELVLSGTVDRVISIQGAIGGSPVADSIAGAGPIRALPVHFRGLDSLQSKPSRELFGGLLVGLRHQLQPADFDRLSSRIFYVRAREDDDGQVALELKATHAFLKKQGSGENDGLLLVEDQKLDGIGKDLGVVRGDHAALTVRGVLSTTKTADRKAFTRALVREVFGGDPPKAGFPDAVLVKSPSRTFNWFFFYALDERGRIWIKPIQKTKETEGFAPGWQLFGSGLPANPAKKDFVKPRRIVEIQGDADEVMCVSDAGRHYMMRWLPNPVFAGTPRKWSDVHGWPVEGPLVRNDRVKNARGWGIGRRNQIVKWFEDVEGKSFTGGGGLTTIYYLSADGTEICFTDSGLPPDFSHTMYGPRRSTFVARGFDVSASTMFVIGERGEMFTRMADFDTVGSDVMFFDYTYDRRNRKKSVIAVPGEEWLEHAKIPLEGQARISSQITIALTGQHNRGRELRVAGLDAEGRPGYWAKPIFEQKDGSAARLDVRNWVFHVVPDLELDRAKLLDPELCRSTEPAPGAPSRDVRLPGKLEIDSKASPVAVELVDWNVECTPATLRLSSGGEHVDYALHTVEEWFHLPRLDPGRDGTPKKYVGTLEARATQAKDAKLRAAVEALAPYHLHDFAFWMEGTNDYVVMDVRDKPRRARKLAFSFTRAGGTVAAARRRSLRRDGFTLAASAERLKVSGPLEKVNDAATLEEKIRENEALRRELAESFEAPAKLDAQTPFFITGKGIKAVKGLATALGGAAYWAPYVKNLMREVPTLLVKNDELKETVLCISREDFERANAILDTRLAAYRRRLAEVKGSVARGSWIYHETPGECWAELAFGQRDARASAAPAGAKLAVDDTDLTESQEHARRGFVVEADCGQGERVRLRVTPRDLARRIFDRSLEAGRPLAAKGKPLALEARVALEYLEDGPGARAFLERVFTAPADREAEEGAAALTIEAGRYALKAGSVLIEWTR